MTLRWASAFSARGSEEVAALWRDRDVDSALMILGAGFDPRAAVAYELISKCAQVDALRCGLPMPTLAGTHDLAQLNQARVASAAQASHATVIDHDSGGAETGMAIARSVFELSVIERYKEIVVDVSAMPRGVYFPLIRGLIEKFDRDEWKGQLHVVATDNPAVDELVTGEGVETPRALPGFSDLEGDEAELTIWVPVLGEGEAARLEVLNEDIRAGEICPVLPFPASDPRRADNLITEYRALLLDSDRVELRNFIYAHESNPFDLYQTLSELNVAYADSLAPLGTPRMVLSAHSSKLLSIGVLLTAFEQGLEVRHASPSAYGIGETAALDRLQQHNFVVDLWLTGSPYE